LIVFHGATWHGAFPRKIRGMRISIANYFRHMMVTSQEDIQGSFDRQLADDCADPALFKELAGFNDVFPYKQQSEQIPTLKV
jgi:ectoine hydroxylase-related dioxygenase (phytanoyl-CoA dioxygenase family)